MITTNASTLRRLMLFFLQSWTLWTKCLAVLLYGVEACPLLVRDRKSFDLTIPCSFMKLFRTGSVTVVTDCQKFSHFFTSHLPIGIRTVKFLQKFQSSDNHVCNLFSNKAEFSVKNIFCQYGIRVRSAMSMTWTNYREHFLRQGPVSSMSGNMIPWSKTC